MKNTNLPTAYTVKVSGAPFVLNETEETEFGNVVAVDDEPVVLAQLPVEAVSEPA